MSYQQLIAGKVKLNGLEGLRSYLQECERVKTNPNIDLSRSHLNYCIEELAPDHLSRRVKEHIAQLHLKKHPRSDAVALKILSSVRPSTLCSSSLRHILLENS